MIRIYKTKDNSLTEIRRFEKNSWVNLINPTAEEIRLLKKKIRIPEEFLTDPLDINERARAEKEDGIVLIIVRIPKNMGKDYEEEYITIPLGIIITPDIIVTICNYSNAIIDSFTNNNVKNFSTHKKSRFVLQILNKTALLYLNHLRDIDAMTSIIEKELHQSMRNEELIKLLNIEKYLVYFTTSLKANEFMMEKLNTARIIQLYPDDKDILEDVIIDNKQAIEMANIHSNILSGMMDAFASVISNNLNIVMKFLTSITIILMIPTLVASIYGMNIPLPLQHSPYAFALLMLISLGLSVIGTIIFLKRKIF